MNPLVLAALLARSASAQPALIPQLDDPAGFALTLYQQVAADADGGNVLVSPLSAREAVGLAYIGARGATADGLSRALRAGRRDDFAAAAERTRADLRDADPRVEVRTATSLWLRSDWKFLPDYVHRAQDGFGAEVFRRDFSAKTVHEVNGWVTKQTHGRISTILDSLDPKNDAAVLLNAIYFRGDWRRAFDEKRTKDRDFHLASGKIVQSPRMAFGRTYDDARFDYAEDENLQAVSLPYGSGRLKMILVLPAKPSTLAALNARLSGVWWRTLRSHMRPRTGVVEIPRFKFKREMSLNASLIAMGASAAFDRRSADFRDMAEAKRPADMLYISRVFQKAEIEVNETGTIASAATSALIAVRGSAMRQGPPPFVFVADRPFLFAIEDGGTGALLFVGAVQDPR